MEDKTSSGDILTTLGSRIVNGLCSYILELSSIIVSPVKISFRRSALLVMSDIIILYETKGGIDHLDVGLINNLRQIHQF